jgi:hypothetical protein
VLSKPFVKKTATDEFRLLGNISNILACIGSIFTTPGYPADLQLAASEVIDSIAAHPHFTREQPRLTHVHTTPCANSNFPFVSNFFILMEQQTGLSPRAKYGNTRAYIITTILSPCKHSATLLPDTYSQQMVLHNPLLLAPCKCICRSTKFIICGM